MNRMKLKGKRIELGYTQSDLAKLISISKAAYAYKEQCKNEFRRSEIESIANVLKLSNTDIMDIFFEIKLPNGNDEQESEHN